MIAAHHLGAVTTPAFALGVVIRRCLHGLSSKRWCLLCRHESAIDAPLSEVDNPTQCAWCPTIVDPGQCVFLRLGEWVCSWCQASVDIPDPALNDLPLAAP